MDSRLVQVSGDNLVVHGGAVMVIHPSLLHPKTFDYVDRSIVSEYRVLGFPDAGQRPRMFIAETAYKFRDWMNDDEDVALPWALECAMTPILLSQTRFSKTC